MEAEDGLSLVRIAIKGANNPRDETSPSRPRMPSYVVGEVLEPENYFTLLSKYPESTSVRFDCPRFSLSFDAIIHHTFPRLKGFIVLNTDQLLPENFVEFVNNHRLEVEAEVQIVG